jgi:hypothetical protein
MLIYVACTHQKMVASSGTCDIVPMMRFPTTPYPICIACEVPPQLWIGGKSAMQ